MPLAQANVARMRAPLDDPRMADFVAWLEPLNQLADASEGFVWRLQTESGDNTALRAFEDPLILLNLSVWESLEALSHYVHRSDHTRALQQRQRWFERFEGPSLALWWIPAGALPTPGDAKEKLALIGARGPTPDAFTFRTPYPEPARWTGRAPGLDPEERA